MTEVVKILEKGHMAETEEGILHSEVDLEITLIQEGQQRQDNYIDRSNSR